MIEKDRITYNEKEYEWIVLSEPSKAELSHFSRSHAIPIELHSLNNETDISYYNRMPNDNNEFLSVLHLPFWKKKSYGTMDTAESTVTFIFSEHQVICILNGLESSSILSQLKQEKPPHDVMIETINLLYNDIEDILNTLKLDILKLKREAKERANRDVLLNLTDLEQELVFFSRRIEDFDETISQWSKDEIAIKNTLNSDREMIALRVKKSQYNSHLYMELIESTSGLLSDSIDNKLNSIMEFLQSIGLVISIPTLIFSLFGMNTGGLAGRQSPFGTVVVVSFSLLLGIVMALYLKRKDYM